jgi:transcriptional regulator with XRE-family HTH domain
MMSSLGPRLRALRQERQWSLRKLASAASVSASLLSDIECGHVNPTVGTLFSLANALGVSAQTFFAPETPAVVPDATTDAAPGVGAGEEEEGEGGAVVRRAGRAELPLTGGITWQRLTPRTEGVVEFMEMRYEPGATSGEALHHHPGREFGLVLEGELTLQLGFRTHTLHAGDSVAFDSTTPHRLANRGAGVLRMAWVNINRAS